MPEGKPYNGEKPSVFRDQGWSRCEGDSSDEKGGLGSKVHDAFKAGLRCQTWFPKALGSHEKLQSSEVRGSEG